MATSVQGRFSATREAAPSRAPSIWRVALLQRWFIVISGAFVLLRIPSFIEPPWYSDAGTYADIGWALNHGARLYVDVWDNKPPGIYWLSALLVGHLQVAIAMPLASMLSTGVAAVCVASIGRRVGGAGVGTIAALSYVVVASLPNLDGDLFNAELFGATFVAAAIAIVVHSSRPRWLIVAGALAGLALLFKGVFAADLVVVMGIAAIVASPRARTVITNSGAVLAGWTIVAAAAGLALFEQGALAAAIAVLARSDVGYVATYGSQGFAGISGAMLTAARVLVPVSAGAGVAAAFVVRGHPAAAALTWWLGWDVASSMVSGRGFPHYVQQAEPAICVALAVAASALWRRYGHKGMCSAATVGAAVISCFLVLLVPPAELSLAHGRGLPGPRVDGVPASMLPTYYVDGYHRFLDPLDLHPKQPHTGRSVRGFGFGLLPRTVSPGDAAPRPRSAPPDGLDRRDPYPARGTPRFSPAPPLSACRDDGRRPLGSPGIPGTIRCHALVTLVRTIYSWRRQRRCALRRRTSSTACEGATRPHSFVSSTHTAHHSDGSHWPSYQTTQLRKRSFKRPGLPS